MAKHTQFTATHTDARDARSMKILRRTAFRIVWMWANCVHLYSYGVPRSFWRIVARCIRWFFGRTDWICCCLVNVGIGIRISTHFFRMSFNMFSVTVIRYLRWYVRSCRWNIILIFKCSSRCWFSIQFCCLRCLCKLHAKHVASVQFFIYIIGLWIECIHHFERFCLHTDSIACWCMPILILCAWLICTHEHLLPISPIAITKHQTHQWADVTVTTTAHSFGILYTMQ